MLGWLFNSFIQFNSSYSFNFVDPPVDDGGSPILNYTLRMGCPVGASGKLSQNRPVIIYTTKSVFFYHSMPQMGSEIKDVPTTWSYNLTNFLPAPRLPCLCLSVFCPPLPMQIQIVIFSLALHSFLLTCTQLQQLFRMFLLIENQLLKRQLSTENTKISR